MACWPSPSVTISFVTWARRKLRSIKRAWPGSSSTSKIVTDCSAGMGCSFWALVRNGEGKRCAHPERGVAPDLASMAPHEHAHIGQAHAFPWHVLLANTAEGLKDFGDIVRGNAPSVVAHCKDRDLGLAFPGDDD